MSVETGNSILACPALIGKWKLPPHQKPERSVFTMRIINLNCTIMDTKSVKAIEAWRLSVKWEGKYRCSPEYSTPEQACKAIVAFVKNVKCPRFLPVTVERVIRYVAAE